MQCVAVRNSVLQSVLRDMKCYSFEVRLKVSVSTVDC